AVAYDFDMAVWAPLTWIDDSGTLTYVAADSVTSDDATTWTITLKTGWTFQDGTPVTAQDYVDTWNVVAYGPNAFENSGQLAHVVGYTDLNPADGSTPTVTQMSGLAVVDDLTFTVTLDGPDGQFPLQLSQGQTAMYPMPASAADDLEAYNKHPIGNGQYQIVGDYAEGETITVEKYADYQGTPGTVDQIEFIPYVDNATAYTDVQAGNIDVAGVGSDKLVQAQTDFGDRLYAFEAAGIAYLGLPLYDDRYQDIRIRQAISMAIDRDTINEQIYGGLYTPATAFTPAIEIGTPVGLCGELCEYHPEEAKALLAEAGGFSGTMTVYYPGGIGADAFYTAIANQLRQNLGVDAVAQASTDWAEFYQTRLDKAAPGPYFSRWGALYPSQQNHLRAFFIDGGGCENCVAWYDGEVASLLATADAQVDADAAATAYKAVQERILEEFPAVPLFDEAYSYVVSERVADLPTSAVGNPTYTQVVMADGA
ncbi:MAG: ABC transporter substrate-binding protein, partial [Actinobacteria bacterium]|nr:ABC transporter substrate-binding protein [Actinomycetota bacterium]